MSHSFARPITLMQPERLVFPPGWVGHIPFAFWIVEQTRPRLFVELGTHTGNSFGAFVQAASTLSLEGRFVAVDHWRGDEHAGNYAEDTFEEVSRYFESRYAGFAELMRMNFDDAVANFEDGSIDLLHIDGFHTYDAVKHDFETWLPKMSGQGVVLLHDTAVRQRDFGVFRLMEELSRRYPTFEFDHSNGLGIVQTGNGAPDAVKKLAEGKVDNNGLSATDYFSRIGDALIGRASAEILLGQPLDGKPLETGLADIMWRKQEIESENEHLRAMQAQLAAEKERIAEDSTRLREALATLTAENEKQVAAGENLAAEYAGLMAEKDRLAAEARTQEELLALAGDYLAEGREMLPFFDRDYYLDSNPDVVESGIDPLLHYLAHGRREGRLPKAPAAAESPAVAIPELSAAAKK